MTARHFRLVFKELAQGVKLKQLVHYFHHDLGIAEPDIKNILTSPPRILCSGLTSKQQAENYQRSLELIGCHTDIDPVIADPSLCVPLSEAHYKTINKELSKVLRTRSSLVLFLASVSSKETTLPVPSMLGLFEEMLEQYLRMSDTILGVDDSRIIILGFAADRKGAAQLEKRIRHAFSKELGDTVAFTLGFAVFPAEAASVSELLDAAQQNTTPQEELKPSSNAATVADPQQPVTRKTTESEYSLSFCFNNAYGSIFQKFLTMDVQRLWSGLSRLDTERQHDFLSRIPFDSPVIPSLEKCINGQGKPSMSADETRHFEAIINSTGFQETAQKRKKIRSKMQAHIKNVESLPTLPSVALEIFRTASRQDASVGDLTVIIQNDPALTSKLLKTVNSAYYGFSQKISTVHHAAVILGTDEIMNLAFSLAASEAFDVTPLPGMQHPQLLWHHALGTALITKQLSESLPAFTSSSMFTAGLLHDLGKIFLVKNIPDTYATVLTDAEQNTCSLFESEEEHLGFNHARIGESIAARWKLPDLLLSVIAFHHHPYRTSIHAQETALVGLADYLYYEATKADGMDRSQNATSSTCLTYGHVNILKRLYPGLTHDTLNSMRVEAGETLNRSRPLFQLFDQKS